MINYNNNKMIVYKIKYNNKKKIQMINLIIISNLIL